MAKGGIIMILPSIDKLLTKVDSKYSLAVAAAKRARTFREGEHYLIEKPFSNKYVGVALEEIASEKILVVKR